MTSLGCTGLFVFLAAVLSLSGRAVWADPIHLVFPAPGHPEYPQEVRAFTFPLLQAEKRAFVYSYRARCEGLSPDTPADNSNFGVNLCVRYMDGSVKWFDPGRESGDGFRLAGEGVRPSPRAEGWQDVSGLFHPPRAVSNVTMYCRIARKGQAWFDCLSVREQAPAAVHGPCSLVESNGCFHLENDFLKVVVDSSRGGSVVRLLTKSNGVEQVARSGRGVLFDDMFEGCAANTSRVYSVVRHRDTPSAASVTLRLTAPAGHQFLEVEKTFALSRTAPGLAVTRAYRNLPAAMSDVDIVPSGEGSAERITVPLGGTAVRTRIFFAPAREDGSAQPPSEKPPFRLELSREVVSPHTPWLRPYAGGRTRALFILDIRQQREIVELAQRMDLDFRTVRIAYVRENMTWGMIERYSSYSFADMNRDLAVELADGRYDVIVLAGRLWDRLDEANRASISRMLDSGTGLVAVENRALVPSSYVSAPAGAEWIKYGLPDELLPFGANRIGTFEKGSARAVWLGYKAFDGLTPFVPYDRDEPAFAYADYTLALVAKCLLWAARKDIAVPPTATVEESIEDPGDGRPIRRRIFSGPSGRYGFSCERLRGDSFPEAKARLAERARVHLFPASRPEWPDFPFSIGECCHRNGVKRYLLPLRYGQLRRLGVNQIRFWAVDPPDSYRPYFPYGLGFDFPVGSGGQLAWNRFQQEFSEPYARTKDLRYLCRTPCLNDPVFLSNDLARVAATVDRLASLHPVSYDCGDENSLTRWSAQFDFCRSEHCLRGFREWLKGIYASLQALNGAWGTAFKEWEDVVPDLTEEARARAVRTGCKAYGAWADHRRFMELTYARYFEQVKKTVVSRAPGVRFDMSGTQPPNGWTGMDMWLIGRIIDLPALYDVENLGEIIRSFNRPFAHPWFGYRFDGKRGRWRAWNDAFRFLDFGISFYHEGLMLMPDYTVPEPVEALADALADLRAGGARLLRSLEAEEEALIHYSQASVHAAQIEERYADFLGVRDSWCRRLVACGVQFRFAAYAELEDGILDRTSAKTIVLPQSAALSDGEVAALRRFAARGGCIVGDAHSGRMDEHCRERESNPLSGLVRTQSPFGPESADGVRIFRFRSRSGCAGLYFGLTRDVDAKGACVRQIALPEPAFVYDLRAKRNLGRVSSFKVPLAPGDAAFFAALPYEVKSFSAAADGAPSSDGEWRFRLKMAVSDGKSVFHPVKVDVYDESGNRLESFSGMTELAGGEGVWRARLPRVLPEGGLSVVFTDFITARTALVRLESDARLHSR